MNRVLTAIGLIVVAVYLVFFSPNLIFTAAALTMSVLCYLEFAGLVAQYEIRRPGLFGILQGIAILLRPQDTLFVTTIIVVALLALSLRMGDLRQILTSVSATIFGSFYTFAPWRFAIDLRQISIHLLFFGLATNWIGDTAAYYVGRRWGKHQLAPIVSPKKSWEGAFASVAASVVFGLIYLGRYMTNFLWWEVVLAAIAANVAGQLGDLAESAIKRGAGVKDSGTMLPGHGGILDRVDSSLFALPTVYGIYLILSLIHRGAFL